MHVWRPFLLTLLLWAGLTGAAAARPPAPFRDCPTCPEMVEVPAGSFMMGASAEVEARQGMPASLTGETQPVHKVTFAKPFAIGEYPVTVAQFRAFVQDTGYDAGAYCYIQHLNDGHMIYEGARGYSWRDPGFPQADNHPVVCVSWDDATAYAAWLSKKTGRSYSLPSEAEFEYAMRGGTTTDFYWGDGRPDHDDPACLYANIAGLESGRAMGDVPMGRFYRFQCSDGYAYTSPVGSYRPNAFGLYDMIGNVWELLEDCWNPTHAGAPADGATRTDGDCNAHPSMGGSFGNAAFGSYAGVRHPRTSDYRGHSWGFRVVRRD
jgi:formylglycine-generating enzyme required for sulfatase activity